MAPSVRSLPLTPPETGASGPLQASCAPAKTGVDGGGTARGAAAAGGRGDAQSRATWAGRCSTAPCCCGMARWVRRFTKRCCPPTTCSTRTATSSRRREPQILDFDGWRLGISICEDVWNDRDFWQRRRYHQRPDRGAGAGRRGGHSQPFGIALHGGQTAAARKDAQPHGAEVPLAAGYRQPGGRQRRPDFRRPQRRLRRAGPACSRAPGASTDDVIVVDLADGTGTIAADDFEPEAEVWHALVLGVRDYARKTRFPPGAAGAFRRHRFGAHRGHRGRGPGPGKRAGRDDALVLLQRGQRGRFAGTGAQPGHPHHRAAHRGHHGDVRRACWRTPSAAASPTSPRRISSRAFAAAC